MHHRPEAKAPIRIGYVLKKDSPSWEMVGGKVYHGKGPPHRNGRGQYAEALLACSPQLSVEKEGSANTQAALPTHIRPRSPKASRQGARRPAFTLVELLVVIAIIGILIALLLPAVQSAREAARRVDCSNRLKQIALALHNYHGPHKSFPPGGITAIPQDQCLLIGNRERDGGPNWAILILPFMEAKNRYDRYDFDGSFAALWWVHGADNHDLQFQPNDAFHCPSDPNSGEDSCSTNYYGCQGGGPPEDRWCGASIYPQGRIFYRNGIFANNSGVKISRVTDGTSKVFLVGETKYCPHRDGHPQRAYASWDSALRIWPDATYPYPQGLCATTYAINSAAFPDWDPSRVFTGHVTASTFGSHHPGGCHFAMADASIHFISETIDISTYRSLGIRDDGYPMGGFTE